MDKKNSELLTMSAATAKLLLGPYERQRYFVLGHLIQTRPCPVCGTQQNFFLACRKNVDDVDLMSNVTHGEDGEKCRCTNDKCNATLLYTLPMMGPWYWRRDFVADGLQPKSEVTP